jgi:hypothetical protein
VYGYCLATERSVIGTASVFPILQESGLVVESRPCTADIWR